MGRTWDHGDGFPDWEVLQSSVGPSRRSNPDQEKSEVGCGGWLFKLQYAKWGTFLRSCVSIFAGYMSKIWPWIRFWDPLWWPSHVWYCRAVIRNDALVMTEVKGMYKWCAGIIFVPLAAKTRPGSFCQICSGKTPGLCSHFQKWVWKWGCQESSLIGKEWWKANGIYGRILFREDQVIPDSLWYPRAGILEPKWCSEALGITISTLSRLKCYRHSYHHCRWLL